MSILDTMDKQLREDKALSAREQECYGKILADLDQAERKAIDSLARYKFQMFGYWAAIWVHLNRISSAKRPSPFKSIVNQARIQGARMPQSMGGGCLMQSVVDKAAKA